MMNTDLLFCLLSSHFICDFILQTDSFCKGKSTGIGSKELYIHSLCVLVVTWLSVWSIKFFCAIMVITLSHFVFDYLKCCIDRKIDEKFHLWTFLIDQGLHISILFVVARYWVQVCNPDYHCWFADVDSISKKIALLLFMIMLCWKPANILIKDVLASYSVDVQKSSEKLTGRHDSDASEIKQDAFKSGRLIGFVERIIVIFLVISSQYTAMAFLATAKSILRITNDKDNLKSEYIVAGTFLSISIAIICGRAYLLLVRKWVEF